VAVYEYRESEILGVKRRYEYLTGALLVRVSLFKGLYMLEGRWDSGIHSVLTSLEPGDVPTRHRSIGVVLAIF